MMRKVIAALLSSALAIGPALAQSQVSPIPPYGGSVLEASPGNPVATTSTTGAMMGLGSTCVFTPKYSTRANIHIDGAVTNSGTNISSFQLRWGTGAAPTNPSGTTPPAGTGVGSVNSITSPSANAQSFFFVDGSITGLTPGTQIWIDLNLFGTAGTTSVLNLSCGAFEI